MSGPDLLHYDGGSLSNTEYWTSKTMDDVYEDEIDRIGDFTDAMAVQTKNMEHSFRDNFRKRIFGSWYEHEKITEDLMEAARLRGDIRAFMHHRKQWIEDRGLSEYLNPDLFTSPQTSRSHQDFRQRVDILTRGNWWPHYQRNINNIWGQDRTLSENVRLMTIANARKRRKVAK